MARISNRNGPNPGGYDQVQIVARANVIGQTYGKARRTRDTSFPIYEYLTIWRKDRPAQAVKFSRAAPVDEEGFLRVEELNPGEIVLNPGLVYRPCEMNGVIMAAHLKAMQTWRPKIEYVPEVDRSLAPIEVTIKPEDINA